MTIAPRTDLPDHRHLREKFSRTPAKYFAYGLHWRGRDLNQYLPWLRWWDAQDNLLLTGQEQAQSANGPIKSSSVPIA